MSKIYEVPAEFAAKARIRKDDYQRMYDESVKYPEAFWSRMGHRVDWIRPYTRVKDVSYDARDFRIRWFYDGQLNGAPAGQSVFHIHFHVVPRREGFDLRLHAREMADPAVLAEHAARVRAALD